MKKTGRIWELDFLRGVAIVLMVLDHMLIDLTQLNVFFSDFYATAPDVLRSYQALARAIAWTDFRLYMHYVFAALFLFLTGISCSLSRSNVNRSVKILIFAGIISIVTAFIDTVLGENWFVIYFGILHCMGVSVLLYALIQKVFKSDYVVLGVGALLMLGGILLKWYDMGFVYELESGSTGIWHYIKLMLGLERGGSDHFGLMPGGGLLLVGAYVGRKFYSSKRSLLPMLDGSWNRGISFVGRNTLWIYVLHQPVVMLIVVLMGLAGGLTLAI